MTQTQVSIPFLLVLALGCQTTGTQPHDMSAAGHEAAAAGEERAAAEHSAQYDPNARESTKLCEAGGCWDEATNPTAGHREAAEQARDLAAKHRAASQALRDAEVGACSGLADEDRDMSPFSHGADIQSVSPLYHEANGEEVQFQRPGQLVGATVVFRATPGLTAEWLQRIVDCHFARNAAVGHDMPEMPDCPLVPQGAQATVRSAGGGFAVDVYADDAPTASEILRRAQRIKSGGHTP